MRQFQQTLFDTELMELDFVGYEFTWCNRRFQPYMVWECIDRACTDSMWLDKFVAPWVIQVDMQNSDHVSLLIECATQAERDNHKWQRTHRFCFDATWLNKFDCARNIESIWNEPVQRNSLFKLWEKLNSCRVGLVQWNKESGVELKKRIDELKTRIQNLDMGRLLKI